jgi:hypothetical protein
MTTGQLINQTEYSPSSAYSVNSTQINLNASQQFDAQITSAASSNKAKYPRAEQQYSIQQFSLSYY